MFSLLMATIASAQMSAVSLKIVQFDVICIYFTDPCCLYEYFNSFHCWLDVLGIILLSILEALFSREWSIKYETSFLSVQEKAKIRGLPFIPD